MFNAGENDYLKCCLSKALSVITSYDIHAGPRQRTVAVTALLIVSFGYTPLIHNELQ